MSRKAAAAPPKRRPIALVPLRVFELTPPIGGSSLLPSSDSPAPTAAAAAATAAAMYSAQLSTFDQIHGGVVRTFGQGRRAAARDPPPASSLESIALRREEEASFAAADAEVSEPTRRVTSHKKQTDHHHQQHQPPARQLFPVTPAEEAAAAPAADSPPPTARAKKGDRRPRKAATETDAPPAPALVAAAASKKTKKVKSKKKSSAAAADDEVVEVDLTAPASSPASGGSGIVDALSRAANLTRAREQSAASATRALRQEVSELKLQTKAQQLALTAAAKKLHERDARIGDAEIELTATNQQVTDLHQSVAYWTAKHDALQLNASDSAKAVAGQKRELAKSGKQVRQLQDAYKRLEEDFVRVQSEHEAREQALLQAITDERAKLDLEWAGLKKNQHHLQLEREAVRSEQAEGRTALTAERRKLDLKRERWNKTWQANQLKFKPVALPVRDGVKKEEFEEHKQQQNDEVDVDMVADAEELIAPKRRGRPPRSSFVLQSPPTPPPAAAAAAAPAVVVIPAAAAAAASPSASASASPMAMLLATPPRSSMARRARRTGGPLSSRAPPPPSSSLERIVVTPPRSLGPAGEVLAAAAGAASSSAGKVFAYHTSGHKRTAVDLVTLETGPLAAAAAESATKRPRLFSPLAQAEPQSQPRPTTLRKTAPKKKTAKPA